MCTTIIIDGFCIVIGAIFLATGIGIIGVKDMFFNNEFRRWNSIMAGIIISFLIMIIGFGIVFLGAYLGCD